MLLAACTSIAPTDTPPTVPGAYEAPADVTPLASTNGTVQVNPAQRFQEFEGWGTSLAWWANVLGGWSSTNRNAIADLIFKLDTGDPTTGLGFNVVRYNIGAGPNPHPMRPGAEMPTFQPAAGQWDWSADANQRWMLRAAKDRGANIFEAFVNSPPAWMTYSGCTSGNTNAANDNLRDDQYDNFANYLAEVTKRFRDDPNMAGGITFRTVSAFNEANSNFWFCGNRQEGAHLSRSNQNRMVKLLGQRLANQGLTGTSVAAPDETDIEQTIGSFNSYDSVAKGYVSQLNAHTYQGSDREGFRDLAAVNGKRSWVSEYGHGEGPHNHEDMASGLRLSRQIRNDLAEMQVNAWVNWQVVEDEQDHNYGQIHATFSGGESYFLTRQYYIMGNYSKFIRPDYRVIYAGDPDTLAAHDSVSNRLVLIVTNDSTANVSKTFDLSGFSGLTGAVTSYRTSATENLYRQNGPTLSGKSFVGVVPPKSVMTFVVTGASYNGSGNVNRISNPSFDDDNTATQIPSSWSTYGPHADADYTETQDGARSGTYHGTHWKAVKYDVYTAQLVSVANGIYTVSAWVRSSGGQSSAHLEAKDFGGTARTAAIPATSTWTQISIPNVNVTNGQITVGLYSDANAGNWIHFDDIGLVKQ